MNNSGSLEIYIKEIKIVKRVSCFVTTLILQNVQCLIFYIYALHFTWAECIYHIILQIKSI